ncbi:MAG: hypothetical protein HFJ74_00865 [Eggerthellaceae bacterium]|jgi:hypothetical protein|nr:hypothetical protein [Eggerthellaceae bacterium]
MSELKHGDYILFSHPDGYDVLGRVACVQPGKVFVCFTDGCTAEACDPGDLRKVGRLVLLQSVRLGHHRFDDECPDYDPDCCAAYCPDKGGE